jgi:N-acyl-D-amino-acid deacylase
MSRTFTLLAFSAALLQVQPLPRGAGQPVPPGFQINPYTGVPMPAPVSPNAMTGAGMAQQQGQNPFTGNRVPPMQRNPFTGQVVAPAPAPNSWTRPGSAPVIIPALTLNQGWPEPEVPVTGEAGPGLGAFDKAVLDIMNRHGIPGASLSIAKDGRLVFARGYGWANLGTGEKVQPTTLFGLASVSKPLTATAIFKLIEEGKLSLDDRAFAILNHIKPPPGIRPDPRLNQITIRHLLNHSAGWNRMISGDPLNWAPKISQYFRVPMPIKPAHVVAYMYLVPLNFNPGAQWQYSNVGYVILGEIIAKVSGQSYEDYVRTRVLTPMGIRRVLFTGPQETYAGDQSRCYLPGNGVQLPPLQMPWCAGAAGWNISTVDLVRFLTAFDGSRGKAFLQEKSRQTMFALPPPPLRPRPDGTHAGLGWPVVTSAGDSYSYMHDGMWNGMRTFMKRTSKGVNWALAFNVSVQADMLDQQMIKAIVEEVRAEVERIEKYPDIDLFKKYSP